MVETRKNCTDAERCAVVRAVLRAESGAEWFAETRADVRAVRFAEVRAVIRAETCADDYAEKMAAMQKRIADMSCRILCRNHLATSEQATTSTSAQHRVVWLRAAGLSRFSLLPFYFLLVFRILDTTLPEGVDCCLTSWRCKKR